MVMDGWSSTYHEIFLEIFAPCPLRGISKIYQSVITNNDLHCSNFEKPHTTKLVHRAKHFHESIFVGLDKTLLSLLFIKNRELSSLSNTSYPRLRSLNF